MKVILLLFPFFLTTHAYSSGIKGKVMAMEGCAKKAMVWLSLDKDELSERYLLMHTEVPTGGSYKFYTKPGRYQVRATDEVGCEFMGRVEVKDADSEVNIRMVKK